MADMDWRRRANTSKGAAEDDGGGSAEGGGEQGAGKGTRYTKGAESGLDLKEGEPWLLLALFGHTL